MDNSTADHHAELRTWLGGIAELAEAVNSTGSVHSLLDLVARTACRLMGYDFCAVLLLDSPHKVLAIEGACGLSAAYIAGVNAQHPVRIGSGEPGEAPSSRAFRTGRAVALSDITAETDYAWGGVAGEQGYRSIIAVPLMTTGSCVGTLTCYRADVHEFSDDEQELVTTLANQAAIAIETARLRDKERQTIGELQQLNESLREQHALLQRTGDIHRQLTEVALRGEGVHGVAHALATLLERSVLFEDAYGNALTEARADGAVPGEFDDLAAVRQSIAEGSAAEAAQVRTGHAGTSWVTSAVVLDTDVVARMWIPGELAELGPLGHRAIEHAAVVAGLEMLRERTAVEVESRLRGELLTDLLAQQPTALATVVARAGRLGHDLRRPHAVLLIRTDSDTVEPGRVRRTDAPRQVLAAVHAMASRESPRPLVARHGDDVVLLWPLGGSSADDSSWRTTLIGTQTAPETMTAADAIRRSVARATPITVTVAVSRPCTDLADYPAAFRSTRGVLTITQLRGGRDRTVEIGALGVQGLLLQLEDPSELLRFADRVLSPILDYDRRRNTQLMHTLRVYLAHDLSAARTAEALFVHPNTVGLRLKRMEELLDVSLTQPDALLQLTAALAAVDVGGLELSDAEDRAPGHVIAPHLDAAGRDEPIRHLRR
ncbi:helix-turn-helix domain-containing protein [Streptomyces sp. NPDC048254]|uniref:helix-turn-helix domain-containing protein n=1 Tax=Streptomyces sp. NPDC048254 TaxID=3365525 RepID=UPI003718829D